MLPLLKLNISNIYSTFDKTNKLELPAPYDTPKGRVNFLYHALTVFKEVQLKGLNNLVSMKATLDHIPKNGISLAEGHISYDNLRDLIKLVGAVPRSRFIKNMKEHTKLATLTPLFMYAHKLYNNKPYSLWDPKDALIKVAVGSFLYKAIEFQQNHPFAVPIDNSIRRHLVKGKYSDYPGNFFKYCSTGDPVDGQIEGTTTEYPKEWLILDLQLWLANADVRDTSAMLLDVRNFGGIPKARDAALAQQQVNTANEWEF